MEYEKILERLAPCGLDCSRCFNYHDGTIKRLAAELGEALQGFESRALAITKTRYPELADYEAFKKVLDVMTRGRCHGCRTGEPPMPFCVARTCVREKDVEFCYQCDEFPCGRNSYPEVLEKKWRNNNQRMKEVGVEQFYQESLEKPRYE